MPNYMYVPLASNDKDGMLSKEDKKKLDDGGFFTFSVSFDAKNVGTVDSGTSEIGSSSGKTCKALVDMRNAVCASMSCDVQSAFENCSIKFQYSTDWITEDWFDLTESVGIGSTGAVYTPWMTVPESALGTTRKVRAVIENSGAETTGELINLTLLVRANTQPVPDNWYWD